MAGLKVSTTNDYLVKDGRPFFYLADTAWMSFSNLPLADWPQYLAYRKLQGFNALQISILPITHDTSMSDDNIDPFMHDANGNWDFAAYNDAYFDKAEQMVAMAVKQGFVPVLGVLWCSYVPGTRCSKNSPVESAMPYKAVIPFATYAAERFKQHDPIFFISGDTQFESPDEEAYYMVALEAVSAICPDALLTMHLTPNGDLPGSFLDKIDFYMYQSGHGASKQDLPYVLAENFTSYPVKHPVVNAEPPNEGHGRVGEQTRFDAFDIRKATWQSLLSGAKMGVGYGAHGVWMFHRHGMNFLNKQRSFEPYDWRVALALDGAWDVSFAKWVFETYAMFDLEPTELVGNTDREIRAAVNASGTKLAVYCPYSFDIELDFDLAGFEVVAIDLASRRIIRPDIHTGPQSRIMMHQFNGEALSTFRRNRIGFCILHPMTCAGQPCLVENIDGTQINGQFPLHIAPHQPYKNIRALTHDVRPGLRAEVRMEGDTFEMEDQRNWTDASYKTYCTPLDVPFPVLVEAGTRITQRITLKLHGDYSSYQPSNAAQADAIKVTIPSSAGTPLPGIGLGIASHGNRLTTQEIERLRGLHLAHLRADLRLADANYETLLAQAASEARAMNTTLEIALHVSDEAEQELDTLRRHLNALKPPVCRWLIFHTSEKSTREPWVQLARQKLADYDAKALIGAGTNYIFTELNRERPPVDALDYVSYSINPQVHAFDNASLVEALKAQAVTVTSTSAFVGNLPISVRLVTLKMRANPNATGPDPELPAGQLPAQVDSRQMSLFGAAWTLGSLKYLSESGIHSITYYETSGWRGVMETAQGSSLPDQFPALPVAVFPLYQVLADVGEFAGGEVIPTLSSRILEVEAMVLRHEGKLSVMLANFTTQAQAAHLPELRGTAQIRWLDDQNVELAMHTPEAYRSQVKHKIEAGSDGLRLDLPPYALARLDALSLA